MNNELTQRAIELNYSRPFDVHRISGYPVVKNAIDRVLEQVIDVSNYRAANNPKNLSTLRKPVSALALDLYLAYKSSPDLWLGINLNKVKFSQRSRYQAIRIGYRPFKRVVDAFIELGFVEHVPGHHCRDGSGRSSHLTRIKATEQFIQFLELRQPELISNIRMQPLMIKNHPAQEVIICRDEQGDNIEYDETGTISRMRSNLVAINNLLDTTYINLNISDSDYQAINDRMRQHLSSSTTRNNSNYLAVDLSRKRLKRVFNNSSLEQGGRFYDGYWQEIPKEYRPYIRINGGSTVEVDYSGMHIAMLYAQQGCNLEGDAYTLDGFNDANDRNKLKKILNIMINAANEAKAKGAMRRIVSLQELPEGYRDLGDIIEAYKRRHPVIERYFCTGYGVYLQYLDSQIAEAVMTRMMEREVPVLPVHDSFIVRHEHRNDLIRLMETEYHRYVGLRPSTEQSSTVFDLIECSEAPVNYDELLASNLAGIEQLYASSNNGYARYFEYGANWFQLNLS